jgi:hypothetical protein
LAAAISTGRSEASLPAAAGFAAALAFNCSAGRLASGKVGLSAATKDAPIFGSSTGRAATENAWGGAAARAAATLVFAAPSDLMAAPNDAVRNLAFPIGGFVEVLNEATLVDAEAAWAAMKDWAAVNDCWFVASAAAGPKTVEENPTITAMPKPATPKPAMPKPVTPARACFALSIGICLLICRSRPPRH